VPSVKAKAKTRLICYLSLLSARFVEAKVRLRLVSRRSYVLIAKALASILLVRELRAPYVMAREVSQLKELLKNALSVKAVARK
jgi:hypothetical protein